MIPKYRRQIRSVFEIAFNFFQENFFFGGGRKASPAPPPVDRTLPVEES